MYYVVVERTTEAILECDSLASAIRERDRLLNQSNTLSCRIEVQEIRQVTDEEIELASKGVPNRIRTGENQAPQGVDYQRPGQDQSEAADGA